MYILPLSSRSTNPPNIPQYAFDICKTHQNCRFIGSADATRVRLFKHPQMHLLLSLSLLPRPMFCYPQTHLLLFPDASSVIPRCIFCHPQMHLLLPSDASFTTPRCSFCLSHFPNLTLGVQNPKPTHIIVGTLTATTGSHTQSYPVLYIPALRADASFTHECMNAVVVCRTPQTC